MWKIRAPKRHQEWKIKNKIWDMDSINVETLEFLVVQHW